MQKRKVLLNKRKAFFFEDSDFGNETEPTERFSDKLIWNITTPSWSVPGRNISALKSQKLITVAKKPSKTFTHFAKLLLEKCCKGFKPILLRGYLL